MEKTGKKFDYIEDLIWLIEKMILQWKSFQKVL